MKANTRSIAIWAACAGAALALGLLMTAGPSAAKERCWTSGAAQYFNAIHYCVSSVLAPQAGNTYGPEHLVDAYGDGGAAWCEGASGPGAGETITIRIDGGGPFRRLLIGNGYSKSPQTYANNARLKTVEISADTGFTTTVNLQDRGDLTPIYLPGMANKWIRLKIVDVYPGRKFADTCLSYLGPDFDYEEELLMKEQGLLPRNE